MLTIQVYNKLLEKVATAWKGSSIESGQPIDRTKVGRFYTNVKQRQLRSNLAESFKEARGLISNPPDLSVIPNKNRPSIGEFKRKVKVDLIDRLRHNVRKQISPESRQLREAKGRSGYESYTSKRIREVSAERKAKGLTGTSPKIGLDKNVADALNKRYGGVDPITRSVASTPKAKVPGFFAKHGRKLGAVGLLGAGSYLGYKALKGGK